jgi:hypothetical protein
MKAARPLGTGLRILAPSVRGARVPPVGYLLLADSHTFVCRTWDDLAARLVWVRQHGYRTAKARSANGYVDRPLLPSESARLVDQDTRLALREPSAPPLQCEA